MSKQNNIAAYKHTGEHVTINSLKELKEAEMYLEKREESWYRIIGKIKMF